MKINDEIIEIFKEFNVSLDDGICYLISLFYNYEPSYIPNNLKKKVNATGILEDKCGNLHWNVALFENQITGFDWVKTEYVPLFKQANPDKGGHVREATDRMKELFSEFSDIRRKDIIGAVKLYLRATNFKYIREPHYFIKKGVGTNKIRDILTWVDKYKDLHESTKGVNETRKLK